MKLEIHIHTRFSSDSLMPLWLLYLMCRIKHIDAIAITDHNCIIGALKFQKYYSINSSSKPWFVKGIQVIIGSEIMTQEGEIIGLFLSDNIDSGLSAEETVNLIQAQRGVVYIPHPYDIKRNKTVLPLSILDVISHNIDCMEGHNGRNISLRYSEHQHAIVRKLRCLEVVGSDAHIFWELGRNIIDIPGNISLINRDSFLSAIDNAHFIKCRCFHISHLVTKIEKLMKLFLKGDFHEIYRTINRRIRKNNT